MHTIKFPLFEFTVDNEAWPLCQAEKYRSSRIRDWHHKQQLDAQPNFKAKIQYCIEEVWEDGSLCNRSYARDTNFASITGSEELEHICDKVGLCQPFNLSLKPKTKDDYRQLHQSSVDYYRIDLARKNEPVDKANFKSSQDDTVKIAFTVQKFETLKADLKNRISTSIRKRDLLKLELERITKTIEYVRGTGQLSLGLFAKEIDELRDCWGRNCQYDFTFTDDNQLISKAYKLAHIWDIVQYEAFLLDTLAQPSIAIIDEQTKADSVKIKMPGEMTQGALALFYYYCHEKKCLDPFPAGAMVKAYQEVVDPYSFSWKAFQQKYNKFGDKNERLATSNRKALLAVINLLTPYPDALRLAQDELKIAETRNPIT